MSLEDQNKSKQKKDESIAEEIDEGNDNDDDVQREFDATSILEEVDETSENEDTDRENNIMDHLDMEFDEFSTETADDAEKESNDISEEFPSIPGVNEINDNSAEPLEEVHTYTSLSLLFLFIAPFVTISFDYLSILIILFILLILFVINAFLSDRR